MVQHDRPLLLYQCTRYVPCVQALHARSMHFSITRDLMQHPGPSEALSRNYHADGELPVAVSPRAAEAGAGLSVLESTPASAMNERYEYRLPPGLGLAQFDTGGGGEEAVNTSVSGTANRAGPLV